MVAYRVIDPGSEWRLHRDRYKHRTMCDLLGEDNALAGKNTYIVVWTYSQTINSPFQPSQMSVTDLFGVKL
jgi:hypothetical protein